MIRNKKLYSKKQIAEAISFWTKVLENTSPVIDDLADLFGYDVVFGGRKMPITIKNVNNIYDILNKHVFSNNLKKCLIKIEKNGNCTKHHAVMLYDYIIYTDSHDNPTKYCLLTKLGKDCNGNIYNPPTIYVNVNAPDMSVIAIASIIAHEMIHQSMVENGTVLTGLFNQDYNGVNYDLHGVEFKKLADKINANFGLNIAVSGSVLTYDSDSMNALKAFTGNSYKLTEDKCVEKYCWSIRHANGYIEMLLA